MGEWNHPKKFKCLVVEDNCYAADIMAIFFMKNGIDCEIAENGQIGLQMFLQNPEIYDVIFCDLQMPVMDGNEMMRLIRNSELPTGMTIPIVAMSGTITEDVVSKESFNYLLKKPFELRSLLSAIDDVITACCEPNEHL